MHGCTSRKARSSGWGRRFFTRCFGLALVALTALGCQEGPGPDPVISVPREPTVDGSVIYGEDGREDTFSVFDPALLARAASSVALIKNTDLVPIAGNRVRVKGQVYGSSNNLCRDERFWEQEAGAFCSGSLVGPDLILTAGHCVRSRTECASTRFVFEYALGGGGQTAADVDAANVYGCGELLHSEVLNSGSDFALVRLDRAVIGGRLPLSPRRSGQVRSGDSVYVIGHPSGLPQKITRGGQVRRLEAEHFVASLDTYGGNSGSPVFSDVSGELEGVLVRGENDFVRRGSCIASYRCRDDGCRGEDVTRIDRVLTLIDQANGQNPVPNPTPTPIPRPTPIPPVGRVEWSNSTSRPIPDQDMRGITSVIQANQAPSGRRVRISVVIRHPYRGDLVVSVTAPDQRTVILQRRSGGAADDIEGVFGVDLDSFESLDPLGAVTQTGAWTLTVADTARGDVGRLLEWRLIFE